VGSSKNLGGPKVQKVPRQVRKCCFYTVLNPKICLMPVERISTKLGVILALNAVE